MSDYYGHIIEVSQTPRVGDHPLSRPWRISLAVALIGALLGLGWDCMVRTDEAQGYRIRAVEPPAWVSRWPDHPTAGVNGVGPQEASRPCCCAK